MADQPQLYDRIAHRYARWWAPVLRPTAERVLDRIAPLVDAGATRILDVGTGTGTVAIAALRRWPSVEVVGVDASREMAAGARREADAALGAADAHRFRVETASGDRLPFEGGEFDAAVSSFVLQLVPSRHAVLVEMARVLRGGGRFAHVTWMIGNAPFAPDRVLDEVLDEVGIGPREWDGPRGDYPSAGAAAAGLRRAGFRSVAAEEAELVHAFDVEGYARFVEEFDEEDTFQSFSPTQRSRTGRRLRYRLRELAPDELVMRLPVVFAHGDRP